MGSSKRIPLKGNTYPIKEQLKDLGATWNSKDQAWMVPEEHHPQAVKLLEAVPPKRKSSTRRVCAGCGKGGRLIRDMEDGLLKHYNCCDMPPY